MEAALQGPSGRIVLGPTGLTIGRTADNQLVVKDPKASAHHAEMRPGGQGYSIVDLGSTNGTFVNDQRLDRSIPRPLATGDRIRIGDTLFTYTVTGAMQRVSGTYDTLQESYAEYTPTVAAPPGGSFEYTGYGQEGQQPYVAPPQTYPPPQPFGSQQQQYPPPPAYPLYAAPAAAGEFPNYAAPIAQQPYVPPVAPVPPPYAPAPQPAAPVPPSTPKRDGGSRILLIVLAIIVVLGAGGGFLVYRFLTLPQPVISVTSKYQVGSTPAGSTSTAFHVSGQKFSANSAISFLLDGMPVPGNAGAQSDANGNVQADLTVTNAWIIGSHTLTARDANNDTTKSGIALMIVSQGEANTPGPNGAPPDDMKFTLNITVQATDTATGKAFNPFTQSLISTGRPVPAGGTVCQSRDNGQPHSTSGTFTGGGTYTEVTVYQCSGTYKRGQLSYAETVTSDHYSLASGGTCTANTPYTVERLAGTFTAPNTISGTYSADSIEAPCTNNTKVTADAEGGSWTGTI